MKVPAVGESITEVTIGTWMKADGETVALDEAIAEIESDKATFELTAEANGILHIVAQAGETLPIDALVCKIEVTEGATSPAPKPAAAPAETQPTPEYAAGHPSPAAAKILAEKGISPQQVGGSGVGGRITKDDAQKAQKPEAKPAPAAAKAPPSAPAPTWGASREQTSKKLTPLRKTVARRLVAVKNDTAMLTTFNEVDMKPIMDLRKKYKEGFKEKYEVGAWVYVFLHQGGVPSAARVACSECTN